MACGEGYGSAVLARAADAVVGVDANPEAYEHARLRYRAPNLRFERAPLDDFDEPADAVVFLQTIEHLHDPAGALLHLRSLVGERGVVFVSTPNVLTLAPAGAARSDNPWHVREYRAREFHSLCRSCFATVELLALFHARKLRAHDYALRVGWDVLHRRLGLTRRFYDRFTAAISSRDFVLRPARGAGLERALDFVAVCRG
jgi:2-polyprenyl-3-methyl-5-hydroxy-6-metoxy-1,4-benzoquinol methylase